MIAAAAVTRAHGRCYDSGAMVQAVWRSHYLDHNPSSRATAAPPICGSGPQSSHWRMVTTTPQRWWPNVALCPSQSPQPSLMISPPSYTTIWDTGGTVIIPLFVEKLFNYLTHNVLVREREKFGQCRLHSCCCSVLICCSTNLPTLGDHNDKVKQPQRWQLL